ncbi:MAG: hypothetical protein QOH47_2388 [Sphingomonadales bacterium]|nr:hypothetical protein [Sphingomonadales bacterium]
MDDLLSEIEAFRDAHGIAETTFGRKAANDTRLIGQLRDGRELRRATVEKVRRYMLTYGAESTAVAA